MERDQTMDLKLIEARENVVKAREALRHGDKETARALGEKAALLVPNLEDAWLILVAADPHPEDALAYAQKALELNPQSVRAPKALEWAKKQVQKVRAEASFGLTVDALSMGQLVGSGKVMGVAEPARDLRRETTSPRAERTNRVVRKESSARPERKSNWQVFLYAGAVLVLLVCTVVAGAVWSAIRNPVVA
jgi:hypothetical protein